MVKIWILCVLSCAFDHFRVNFGAHVILTDVPSHVIEMGLFLGFIVAKKNLSGMNQRDLCLTV